MTGRSFKVVRGGCSKCNEKEAGVEVCVLQIEHNIVGQPNGRELCNFHKDAGGVWVLTGLRPQADPYYFFDSWMEDLRELENELSGVTTFLTECRRNSALSKLRRQLETFVQNPHARHCASGLAMAVLMLHEQFARFRDQTSDPSPKDWENQIIEAMRNNPEIAVALAGCFNLQIPRYVE